MNELKLHSDKVELKKLIPAKWDELFSLKQALALVKLLAFSDCYSLRFRVLKELLNLKWYKYSDLKFLFYLRKVIAKDIWKLLHLTQWLFNSENLPTNLLLKSIKKKYFCKDFENTEFWQWVRADHYFQEFLKQKEESFLNQMIACFYLKKGEIFETSSVEIWSKRFQNVQSERKQLFLLWYMGNRDLLTKAYSEGIFSQGKQTNSKDFGWAGILDDLSSDVTKLEEVARMDVNTVLFSLNKKIIRNREQEREYEKTN